MKNIDVIMATFNSGPVLEKCLQSIRQQNYDQKKIKILIADGGSTDNTIEIIKKYKGQVIPEKTGSPEAAKAIALKKAKAEILLMVASDNILPNKNWLKKMVAYFDQEPKTTAVYPWRYKYQKKDKLLNRYFSLFGVNDPVAYYLNKADRQSHLSLQWQLAGNAIDKGDYFLAKFNVNNMPTLGDNGFLIKRKLLMKAKVDPRNFFHIDVNLDLVKKGHDRFVVVKNNIIHATGEEFWPFFQKRKKYLENLYLKDLSKRRYHIYHKARDRKKIIIYSLYSLTFIEPTLQAIKGFLLIPDLAWFLHPIVCFLIFWVYFLSVFNWQSWYYLGLFRKRFKI